MIQPAAQASVPQLPSHRRIGVMAILTGLAILFMMCQPAHAAVTPAHTMTFIYLGGVWVYDADTGQATLRYPSEGRSLSSPSVGLGGHGEAYEVRTASPSGSISSSVEYWENIFGTVGIPTLHVLPGAARPAVSPDGIALSRETYGATPAVGVFSLTDPEVWFSNASYACWSPDGLRLAYNENPATNPLNDGFSTRYLPTSLVNKVPVTFVGQTPAESHAWAPQWSPSGNWIAVTKYFFVPLGVLEKWVVLTTPGGATAVRVLNVTDYEHFDYRWLALPGGGERLYLELVEYGNSRPDIYEAAIPGGTNPLTRTMRGCSFSTWASISPEASFADVGASNPYRTAITFMRSTGIISGYAGNVFKPFDPVLRAQFAKMVCGAAYYSAVEGHVSPFTDLGPNDPNDLYPHDYAAMAYALNFTTGTSSSTFSPWDNITRAQVISMVVRAANQEVSGGLQAVPAGWTGQLSWFSDPTHGANVRQAEYNGLLNMIDLTNWNLWAPATRGEVAQILVNFMYKRGPLVNPLI